MKYDHLVKYNGIYYKAGEDVPDSSPVSLVDGKDAPSEDDNKNTDDVKVETVEQDVVAKTYSKTDINRMSADGLKALAPTFGIEVTEETSGAYLKKEIIAKLGL